VYYADGKLKYVIRNIDQGDLPMVLRAYTYTATGQKETLRGPYKHGEDLGINLTEYTYDALGRAWKVTDAEDNVTETRYCPDGQLWRVIDAEDHNNVTNMYNADGSLQKVEDAKGNATEYEYNGFMGLKKTTFAELPAPRGIACSTG